MIDFLFDSKEDQNYRFEDLEITNQLDIYVEQIKMCLESDLGGIMGADVTLDLESMVFEDNLDAQTIENKVRNAVSNFCSLYSDYSTNISVAFAKGDIRDICLISITINKIKTVKILIK
jgi:hypothetical protein